VIKGKEFGVPITVLYWCNFAPICGECGGQFYKMDGFENVYRDIDKGTYQRRSIGHAGQIEHSAPVAIMVP
jgi:hypothetical protein